MFCSSWTHLKWVVGLNQAWANGGAWLRSWGPETEHASRGRVGGRDTCVGKQLCAIRVVTKALYALEEEKAMGISREATLTSRRPEGGRGEDGLPWVAQRWGGAGSSPSVQVVLPPFTISSQLSP